MSTHPAPGAPDRSAVDRADRAFPALLGYAALVFGGFSLLLPVVPLDVSARGGSSAVVGASTAVFMLTTILTQPVVPWLLRARGHRDVLLAGALLLGAPAVGMAVLPGVTPVLVLSAVRGVGFGLATVAGAALVAELVPAERLGRATGAFGGAIGVPQLLTLPAGVALAERVGSGPVFAAGGVLALLGVLAALGVPAHVRPHPGAPGAHATDAGPLVRAGLLPVAVLLALALAWGGAVTFLPLAVPGRTLLVAAALALLTAAMLVGRAAGGVVGDRSGTPGRLLLPGALAAVLGAGAVAGAVAVTSAGGPGAAVLLVVGVLALGGGFGVAQNDALVLLFARAGAGRRGTASAAFNIAYDAGTGVGAAVLGVAVGVAGYPAAFTVAVVVVAVVVPFTIPAALAPRLRR